jgi:hypothetical protein
MKLILEIKYTGFDLNVVSHDKGDVRNWTPGKGEYEKNLFTSYMYRGTMYEYRADNNQLDGTYRGELFVNFSVALDYPTYEHFDNDTTWLCFSSWKPIKSEFHRLTEPKIIPAGAGVFCVLGNFTVKDRDQLLVAKTLNYIKPRDHDITIEGDAKILLFTKDEEFLNKPVD